MAGQQERRRGAEALQRFVHSVESTSGQTLEIDTIVPVEPPLAESNASYFVVSCPTCGEAIPVTEDPSHGALGNPFIGSGSFEITCPKCGQTTIAPVTGVQTLRWPS